MNRNTRTALLVAALVILLVAALAYLSSLTSPAEAGNSWSLGAVGV